MEGLVEALAGLPSTMIYLAAAGLVMLETASLIGLALPAEATLLLVGFLAFEGRLHLSVVLVSMITAAAVGDSLAFRAGRRYGPRLRASRLGQRVGEHRWRRADELVARHGGRAMTMVRWVAFARTLGPRLAGSSGMPYRRFLPWNLAGVVSWVGLSILGGYAAGESYRRLSAVLGHATGAVLALAATAVAVVVIGRRLGRHADPARVAAAGLVLLLAAGLVVGAAVTASGLPALDGPVVRWARAGDGVAVAAAVLARGWAPLVLVAVIVAARRRPRPELIGAFAALAVLAAVAEWARAAPALDLLPVAALCLLAWLVAGGRRWPVAAPVWAGAAVAGLIVAGARLSLGWSTVSGTAAGVLIGAMWAAVFVAAWAARDARARTAEEVPA